MLCGSIGPKYPAELAKSPFVLVAKGIVSGSHFTNFLGAPGLLASTGANFFIQRT